MYDTYGIRNILKATAASIKVRNPSGFVDFWESYQARLPEQVVSLGFRPLYSTGEGGRLWAKHVASVSSFVSPKFFN